LVEVRRHGKLRERCKRDAAGNLVEKVDGAGKTLLQIAIGPGNTIKQRLLASGDVQDFQYADDGRLIEAKSRAGQATFEYNSKGRRTRGMSWSLLKLLSDSGSRPHSYEASS
jgi:hypothetical protein